MKTIVTVVDCPGPSNFVPFPLQVFAFANLSGVVQTLKSWERAPLFVTSNVTFSEEAFAVHGRIDDLDSLNLNSLGFPAVTAITVAEATLPSPAAGAGSYAASTDATATNPAAHKRLIDIDLCNALDIFYSVRISTS